MKTVETDAAVAAKSPSALELCKSLDELWPKRDDPEVVRAADAALAQALRLHGDDLGVLWRAARWQFWRAEMADDSRSRRNLARAGYEYGERALKKDPHLLDARYWTAVCYGIYGEAIGILTALAEGVEGKFRESLDFAIQKQPGYEHGGALSALGRYHASLPWPKRDRKKAVEVLRGMLKQFPDNLRGRVYLAEVLLDSGDAKQARALVEEVLAATPGAYDAPEERLAQKMARALKERVLKAL